MEKLMHAGLVKRIGGKYMLTSLGKITFSMLTTIEIAIKYYWKLKAIDSIFVFAHTTLP
jgi:predicted transcriptional regulator